MSAKRTIQKASRADIFMLIVRLFVLSVARGFAQGKNNHEEELDTALNAIARYGIAPIHLVNVSQSLVALLKVINAEYDAIDEENARLN